MKRKKALKLLHLLWILPLLLVLAVGVLMYVVPAFETADRTEVSGAADWMAALDDAKSLGEIVLPGTHDCATKNVQLAFFSKCQALTVGEQLEAGFRYLDIRLGADGDRLKLMHGFTNCTTTGWPWAGALYLDAVLDDCYAFLSEHPTETVVLAVKQEHGDESVAEFQQLLYAYIAQHADAWLLTERIPTVGEARGKLVLMRRFQDEAQLGANSGIPLLWDNQNGHDDVSKTSSCTTTARTVCMCRTVMNMTPTTSGLHLSRVRGRMRRDPMRYRSISCPPRAPRHTDIRTSSRSI